MQSKISKKTIINDEVVDRFLQKLRDENKPATDITTTVSSIKAKTPKQVKKPVSGIKLNRSELASIRAFKEGRTLESIAQSRRLVMSTVTSHISKGIEAGIIDCIELVDADTIARISAAIELLGSDATRKGIFELLDGKVEYDKINFVFSEKC